MSTQNHGSQSLYLGVHVDFQDLERDCEICMYIYILGGCHLHISVQSYRLGRGDEDGRKDRQGLHKHSFWMSREALIPHTP